MATLTIESKFNVDDRVVYMDDVPYAIRRRTIAGLEGTVIKVGTAEGRVSNFVASNFVRWDSPGDVEYEWYTDDMLMLSGDVLKRK